MGLDQLKKTLFHKKTPSSGTVTKVRRNPQLRRSRSLPPGSLDRATELYLKPQRDDFAAHSSPPAGGHYTKAKFNRDDVYNTSAELDDPFAKGAPSIPKHILEQYAARGTSKEKPLPQRPSKRPPTQNFDVCDLTADDCTTPPNHRMEALRALVKASKEKRDKTLKKSPPSNHVPFVQRSVSSSSSWYRPAGSGPVPGTLQERAKALRKNHVPSNSVSTPYTGSVTLGDTAYPFKSKRHGINAADLYKVPVAVAGLYTHTDTTISPRTIGVGARLQNGASKVRTPEIKNEFEPVNGADAGPADIRRRNASSASSRSEHDARRHGLYTPTRAQQWDPGKSTPERSPYRPDIMRVARGPHAAKLQTLTPIRPMRPDVPIDVTDCIEDGEWGVGNNSHRTRPLEVRRRGPQLATVPRYFGGGALPKSGARR